MSSALEKKPTINDVARLAGIGKATASRALSGRGSIAPATREAVLKAARQLRFEVDPLARMLSGGRNQNLIGLFALNLDLGVGMQKVQKIQHYLGHLGYDVPLYAYSMLDEGHQVNQGSLLRALTGQRPAAIVFKSGNLNEEALQTLQEYAAEGGVLVSYNHACKLACDQVIFDEAAAMERAVAHLVSLGHFRIGLRLHGSANTGALTYQGFVRGLRQAGLQLNEDWIWHEGVYEEGGALLADSYLQMAWGERPTALCIVGDVSASTFVARLASRGVAVPETVSVVGLGDTAAARYGFLPLTSVAEPVDTIARSTADMVHQRLQGNYDGPPRTLHFSGELVLRQSCGPAPAPF